MLHRPPSPLAIDDLPQQFHSRASPPAGSTSLPAGYSNAVPTGSKREASISVDEDGVNEHEEDNAANACNDDEEMDECDIGPSSALAYRPHHPQNHSASPSLTGFGVKGPPGGDCKRICLRHQRMVDGGARVDLQKRLEKLPEVEQQTANTIWSLFSSSSGAARILTLQGLLTMCCPSQLSFLTEQLKAECRLDPFAVLPREVALKCMGYLDAISLGRAAQVSKSWKLLADDDLLWRTMCEQHIERKCEKCGWGLPLLEKRRKQKAISTSGSSTSTTSANLPMIASSSASTSTSLAQFRYDNSQHNHTPLPKALEEALARSSSPSRAKRPRLDFPSSGPSSSANLHLDNLTLLSNPPSPKQAAFLSAQTSQQQLQLTRPWKSVYCERLAIARNWARGKCTFKVLQGHTDAVTCLQIDDSLHDVPYPVLMTGSWDRTIRIWNADTGACISVLKGHARGVRCIQFDSAKLISGAMDSTLKIWSWRTGQCIRTLTGHRDAVISLSFDKHVLASGSADSTIKVWDFNTAECFTLRGHREWVNQVKIWSPESADCSSVPGQSDSVDHLSGGSTASTSTAAPMPSVKLLFSASDDGTVKVWDLITRQCVRTLEGHVAQVQCLKILSIKEPNAAPALLAPEDDSKTFINPSETSNSSKNRSQVTTGNAYEGFFEQDPVASAAAPLGFVTAANMRQAAPDASAFIAAAARPPPDPSTLHYIDFGSGPAPLVISGSLDNTIKLWNVEEANCARTMFGHIEGVWDVDMDKLRIVSASHDRTIKLWDRSSGRCLHTLVGHRGAVTSIALGDDKIISGSDDTSVRIWSFAKQ